MAFVALFRVRISPRKARIDWKAMGRPRKPAKLLEISGAFKKNPQRKRVRAAELAITAGVGEPPEEWTKTAEINGRCAALVRIWNEIVAQDRAALRVLNISHRLLVRNICMLQYKVDRACEGFGKATSGDYANLRSFLTELGQTPASSASVAEAVAVPDRGGQGGKSASGWGELVG